ncbi:MAG TPA: hypothetical protein VH933_04665 [Aestuariivirgaceae bacterium]|jgi:hypothetical protein
MSEFSASSPAMARLFEEVDLASVPQSSIGQDAWLFWRSQRDGELMASSSRLIQHLPAELFPFGFLFSIDEVTGDYVVTWAGHKAFAGLARKGAGTHLEAFDNRRLAARFRLVLNLVKSRGEPVTVRFGVKFVDGKKGDAELFIAPAATEEENKLQFFGCLASRREQSTW